MSIRRVSTKQKGAAQDRLKGLLSEPGALSTLEKRIKALVACVNSDSVNAAAKTVGIPLSTMQRIHSGEVSNPRANILQQIARAYGASIDWLISGQGERPAVLALESPMQRTNLAQNITRNPTPEAIAYVLRVVRLNVSNGVKELLQRLPATVSYASFAIPFGMSPAEIDLLDEAHEAAYASWHNFLRVIIAAEGEERACQILETNKETLKRLTPPTLTAEQFEAAERAQQERADTAHKPKKRKP